MERQAEPVEPEERASRSAGAETAGATYRREPPTAPPVVGAPPAAPLLERSRLVLGSAAGLWVGYLTWAFSNAGVGLHAFLAAVFGAALLGGFWLLLLAFDLRRPSGRLSRLPWLVVPLAGIGVAALHLFGQPPDNPLFRLRFGASRAAFERVAEGARIAPASLVPRRLGLFGVQSIEVHDSQVRFLTTDCGFIDHCGVVYSPVRRPLAIHDDRFQSLGGPWYHVYQRF
jgi:hypothetical protein